MRPASNVSAARATVASVATGLLGQLLLLISGIALARMLGVEGRGEFALTVLAASVVGVAGSLGLSQSIPVMVAARSYEAHDVATFCMRFVCIQGILLALAYTAACFNFSTMRILDCLVPAMAIAGIIASQLGAALLQGIGRLHAFNAVRLLPTGLYAAAVCVVFLIGGTSVHAALLGWAIAHVLAGALSLSWGIRTTHGDMSRSKQPTAVGRGLLGFGIRSAPSTLSPLDVLRIDQWLAGLVLSPLALGLYVSGQAFAFLPRLVTHSIGLVAVRVVSSARGDQSAEWHATRSFLGLGLALSVGFAAGLWILMPLLIELLFGSDFLEAVPVGRILLVGSVVTGLTRLLSDCLRAMAAPLVGAGSEAIQAAVFLGAGYLLSLSHGLFGIAWAVVIAQSSALFFVATIAFRTFRLRR